MSTEFVYDGSTTNAPGKGSLLNCAVSYSLPNVTATCRTEQKTYARILRLWARRIDMCSFVKRRTRGEEQTGSSRPFQVCCPSLSITLQTDTPLAIRRWLGPIIVSRIFSESNISGRLCDPHVAITRFISNVFLPFSQIELDATSRGRARYNYSYTTN